LSGTFFCSGWTGFTFDEHLFPNHTDFFLWCKAMGLKNTLNVHPASGMQPWEEKFAEMAIAMGQDPSTGKYVPYNVSREREIAEIETTRIRHFQHNQIL
jgi:alpha-glucosidase (family GH31 glycosyl hydrolase)